MIAAAASSALILTVASQCARNMIQTASIASAAAAAAALQQGAVTSLSSSSSSSSSPTILDDLLSSTTTTARSSSDSNSIGDSLRKMNRADLLRVFAESRAPTPEELDEIICGSSDNAAGVMEWDGVLLDNNSKIMDLSSNVMTHALFGGIVLPWRLVGSGRKKKGMWKGKAFSSSSSASSRGKGVNRFGGRSSSTENNDDTAAQQQQQQQQQNDDSGFCRHGFEYSIQDSKLLPGTNSLRLVYSKYQSLPISLWHSMNDELRVVELNTSTSSTENNGNSNKEMVLIGMGWMGWSGGPLNCSPFLLERPRYTPLPTTSS